MEVVGSATAVESRSTARIRAVGQPSRLVLAVLLVSASPLVEGSTRQQQVRAALVIALGWIPLSSLCSSVAGRRPARVFDLAALVIDLALLAIMQVALGPSPVVLVIVHLLFVAYYTYLDGRWMGVVATLAGFALVSSAAIARGQSGFDAYVVAVYPFVVASLAWLLDTAAVERIVEIDRVVRLHEKSDALLSGVAEAVMVTSPDGRVLEWNQAAAHTFGCPHDQAVGRDCASVLGLRRDVRDLDCSHGCAVLEIQQSLQEQGIADVEVWRTVATGQRQPLLVSAIPVVDSNHEVVEVVHSFRDITKLKQADEAKTLFLATASHELKTPLTVIRGFSQMLLLPNNNMSADEQITALRAIDVRAGQLTAIVDRLLLSSRIEAGQVDLTPEPIDLLPTLLEQVTGMRAASARDIEVIFDDPVPPVWADRAALATVVDHLLDNAMKYSPGGGAITVAVNDHDDQQVELAVTDEGVGMTEDQMQHCFDRFWQAELSDGRRFGGTGIGLYIVRSLVEAMRGRISVSSAPGRGSTFRVALQRADSPAVRDTSASRVQQPEGALAREYMRQIGVRVEAKG